MYVLEVGYFKAKICVSYNFNVILITIGIVILWRLLFFLLSLFIFI